VVSDLVEVDADLAKLMEGSLIVFVDEADVESSLAEVLREAKAGGGGFGREFTLLAFGDAQVDPAATLHGPPSGCCRDPTTIVVPVWAVANRRRMPQTVASYRTRPGTWQRSVEELQDVSEIPS